MRRLRDRRFRRLGKEEERTERREEVEREILRLLTAIDQVNLTASRPGVGGGVKSRCFYGSLLTVAVVADGDGRPLVVSV